MSGKHPRRRKRRRKNPLGIAPAGTTQTATLAIPVASLTPPAVPLSTIRERFKLLQTRSANG